MYRFRSAEGREWAEAALTSTDEATPERAKALLAAGTLAQTTADIDASMKHLDMAIDVARTLSDNDILGAALNNRANVSEALGMIEEAERLWHENLELSERRDDRPGTIIALTNLCFSALNSEAYEKAISLATRALEISLDLDSDRMINDSRAALTQALRSAGRIEESAAVLGDMVEQEDLRGHRYRPGQSAFLGHMLALETGNLGKATDLLHNGVTRFMGIPEFHTLTGVLDVLFHRSANLMAAWGEAELAAILLGASDAAAGEFPRSPWERRMYDATLELVEAESTDFAEARSRGAETDVLAVFDLILESLKRLKAGD